MSESGEHAHGGPGSRRLCRRLVLGPVIKDLQAHDLPMLAPPNPLRGLAHDAEYMRANLRRGIRPR